MFSIHDSQRENACSFSKTTQVNCSPYRDGSTNKGANWRSKDVTQRPESPLVTHIWHASKYEVHKLDQRYMLILFQTVVKAINVSECQSVLADIRLIGPSVSSDLSSTHTFTNSTDLPTKAVVKQILSSKEDSKKIKALEIINSIIIYKEKSSCFS